MLIELNQEKSDRLSKTEQEVIKYINENEKSFLNYRLWILHLKHIPLRLRCHGLSVSVELMDSMNLGTGLL